jgi:hypothetical protein
MFQEVREGMEIFGHRRNVHVLVDLLTLGNTLCQKTPGAKEVGSLGLCA